MRTCWEHNKNLLRTHWEHKKINNSRTPPPSIPKASLKEDTKVLLSACCNFSLVEHTFYFQLYSSFEIVLFSDHMFCLSKVQQCNPISKFSFMDQLHEQEFTLLLVDAFLNVVWAHLCSCAGPTIGAWFSTCPSTPSFYLSSVHFFTTFVFVLVYHIIYFYIFHAMW